MTARRRHWLPDSGRPQGPQRQFLHDLADVYEVLNAGEVGSGKTEAGIMGAVYYRDYRSPKYKGLILRHNASDLPKEILHRVAQPGKYRAWAGGGPVNETGLFWRTGNGGRVLFAHAKNLASLHGPEFWYVYFDELTHWRGQGWREMQPAQEYTWVLTRVRGTDKPRIRAGTNPYGPGKAWIKWRWGPWLNPHYFDLPVDAPPWMRRQVESLRAIGYGPRPGLPPVDSGAVLWYLPQDDGHEVWCAPGTPGALSRSCLRTRTADNVALAESDPGYAARLRAAGPTLYAQLAGDDWDAEEPGSGFFLREWFVSDTRPIIRTPPRLATVIRRWDFAWSRHERGGKSAERSPWSCGVLMGCTEKDKTGARDWYVLDVVRKQGDPREIKRLVAETAARDGIEVEQVMPVDFSAGKVVIQDMTDMLEGHRVVPHREAGEKHVRIATLQQPAQMGRWHLCAGPWNEEYLAEVERYPRNPVDQLDATAGGYLYVIEAGKGPTAEEIERDVKAAAEAVKAIDRAPARAAADPWGGGGGWDGQDRMF